MKSLRYFPRPPILDSIPLEDHAVIEASAGTGKTYTLEHLVVEVLLKKGIKLPEILVVTFTDKAAAELRVRIRAKIEELVTGEGAPSEGQEHWEIDEEGLQRLRTALSSFDSAAISTIHSFCQTLLRENAFDGGQLFEQSRVDGDEAFISAFQESLRNDISVDPVLSFWLDTWLQSESLGKLEDLLLKSHKARAPVYLPQDWEDLAGLQHFDLSAYDSEALRAELSKKKLGQAGTAIRRRVNELVDLIRDHANAPTPRFLAALVAWRPDEDKAQYIGSRLKHPEADGPQEKMLREMLKFFEPGVPSLSAIVASLFLAPIQRRLNERKEALGLFDFDDLLKRVQEGLRDNPELVEKLRERYLYALVDEFQDTDEVQWEIFKTLFLLAPKDLPSRPIIYVIGDPKQAIYRFRGADIQTYYQAIGELAGDEAGKKVVLSKNYRSTREMIAAYNSIFDQEAEPSFFSKAGSYSDPVGCGDTSRHLLDAAGRELAPIKLLHVLAEQNGPKIGQARAAIAEFIAKEIKEMLSARSGRGMWLREGGKLKKIRANDIFVLGRTRADGLLLGEVFRQHGVPHAFYKQDGLFQTEEAKDIYDLLRAIAKPADDARRVMAWITPFFALTVEEAAQARSASAAHSLVSQLYTWESLAEDRNYAELFAEILSSSGIIQRLLAFEPSERALTNYQHIFEQLLERNAQSPLGLEQLVDWLGQAIAEVGDNSELDQNLQRLETDQDAVQIMTLHASKGLEAAVVFMVGFSNSSTLRPPHLIELDGKRMLMVDRPVSEEHLATLRQDDAEENQRLHYVGITRAKARLYLPFFAPDADLQGMKVAGSYQPLHDRLLAMFRKDPPAVSDHFPETSGEESISASNRANEWLADDWIAQRDGSGDGGSENLFKRAIIRCDLLASKEMWASGDTDPEKLSGTASGPLAEPLSGSPSEPLPGPGAESLSGADHEPLPGSDSEPRFGADSGSLFGSGSSPASKSEPGDEFSETFPWDEVQLDDLEQFLEEDEPRRFESLRKEHAGFIVTSYSALKRLNQKAVVGGGGLDEEMGGSERVLIGGPFEEIDSAAEKAEAEDLDEDESTDAPHLRGSGFELRGGKDMGNFLHQILETVPPESFVEGESWPEWRRRPEIDQLLLGAHRRHGIRAGEVGEVLNTAARICHRALSSPIDLGQGLVLPGIRSGQELIRELEFLYPIPEKKHPALGEEIAKGGLTVSKGFIKGFIDVVFSHQGKTWLADWKSDRVRMHGRLDFSAESIRQHVKQQYEIQAQLYTVALVKMLGIRNEAEYEERFGGLLYLFVRGMDVDKPILGENEGVYRARPSFAEVQHWFHEYQHSEMLWGRAF